MDSTLEVLAEAWSSARAGQGRLVHLEGAPGAGKSTLLGRFLDQARRLEDPALVVLAPCAEAPEGLSHGVVEELILRVADGVRAVDEGLEAAPWLLPGGPFLAAACDLAGLPGGPPRARIFADLLLDVTRTQTVLIALDDAGRADRASRAVVEALATALNGRRPDGSHRLLLVLASSTPLDDPDALVPDTRWWPDPGAVVTLAALPRDTLQGLARTRLARHGKPTPTYLDALADAAQGNPQVLEGLVRLSEGRYPKTRVQDVHLSERPGYAGLAALAEGRLLPQPAEIRADLQSAAVLGARFEGALLAAVWGISAEAARPRIDRLTDTGLVVAEPGGERWAFVAAGVAAHFVATLPEAGREDLEVRVAEVQRRAADARLAAVDAASLFDVTQTWSDGRRTMGGLNTALDLLQSASRHFAAAKRPVEAAEAAVALVEGFFGRAILPQLAGRHIRRAERERRRQLSASLTEAAAWLDLARRGGRTPTLLAVDVRRLVAQARLRAAVGDFAQARQDAATALMLAGHLGETQGPGPSPLLEAARVQVEVCYGAGDNAAARRAAAELVALAERTPVGEGSDPAVEVFAWLAEISARWEWVGLHDRIFPFLIEHLEKRGAARAAVKARVDRLSGALMGEEGSFLEQLIEEMEAAARAHNEVPALAECLTRTAADVIRSLVDRHFDALSGEFFPPDLESEEAGPEPLRKQLARSVRLLDQADALAELSDQPLARLRVLHGTLQVAFEARERLAELMNQWSPVIDAGTAPPRLAELAELLDRGFLSMPNAEALSERIIALAGQLGLHQLLADTAYEALERGLPSAARDPARLMALAHEGYTRIDDVYGLVTLHLVALRTAERLGAPVEPHVEAAETLLAERGTHLLPDQRAFAHQQLGEWRLQPPHRGGPSGRKKADPAAAAHHLEEAIRGYDEVGEVDQVQIAGELLREVYGKLGDLGRYRALRARFRAVEERRLGVDPLGLEMRIEHLLNLAGHEHDDVKAIEMVERCVALFARVPDGTTRIDECFVEISKICRRRADEAQTEGGFQDWIQRSLEAVRTAAAINRSLGNHHRVFEEFHELFDDLLGLGAAGEYFQARAECRELAFESGNIDELTYLFEEHVQIDPEAGFDPGNLPEARAYFEALQRYLRGLGADRHATRLRQRFLAFLKDIGEGPAGEGLPEPP